MNPAEVLEIWYAANPAVRHLWAMEDSELIRVLVTLEPTADGDDALPVWLANGHDWASDLRLRMNREVQLELIVEAVFETVNHDRDKLMIAELYWRDPSAPLWQTQ